MTQEIEIFEGGDDVARPARIKQHEDGTPVSQALQAVQSDYTGKNPAIDLIVERMQEMHDDAAFLRLQWREEPVYWLPNHIMTTHAAFKPWLELQKLMHSTLKELNTEMRIVSMSEPSEADSVDTFLENLERVNRPHRSVNRGEV